MLNITRGALVAIAVAIPIALISSAVLNGTGPLGAKVPAIVGAFVGLALLLAVGAAAART